MDRGTWWATIHRVANSGTQVSTHTLCVLSVHFSHSVMSQSLRPHGLQHARLPCPSPTPRAYSNSCPSSQDAIQPSHPLSSPCPPAFSSSIRVFSNESVLHIRWPKYWSFSFSISPSSEYSGLISFRIDCWISLQSKGLLRVFSNTTVQKHQFFGTAFFIVQLSHPYMTTGKTIALTRQTFLGKVMSLLVNTLSRLVITLLPRSKRLLTLRSLVFNLLRHLGSPC